MNPLISILVTTYNRKQLMQRAMESIFSQSFSDFEVIVIDDYSTDGSHHLINNYNDKRVKLFRLTENLGSKYGDRIHIKSFIKELASGKYFIYLCDDDYWLKKDLLARQAAIFASYPNLAMVIGGQTSNFITLNEKKFHDNLYPKRYMESDEFLTHFSEHPIECNIIGATLYNRGIFLKSGAMTSEYGAKWQAGYELMLAPGSYGDVYYMNEPCSMIEVRPDNASFRSTQLEHYKDSVLSIKDGLQKPIMDWQGTDREKFLMDIRRKTLHNVGQAYLANAEQIKTTGELTLCSRENISHPVTHEDLVA